MGAEFTIKKTEPDKMQVFGWASVAESPDGGEIADFEGDVVTPEELEKAAYTYVLKFRDTGERHNPELRKKGKLIESVVFTKEKQRAIGIPEATIPTGWWVGFQISDPETWTKIKNGEYRMFSVKGSGNRVDYKDSPTPLIKSTEPVAKSFAEMIQKRSLTSGSVPVYCNNNIRSTAKDFNSAIEKFNHNHGARGLFVGMGVGVPSPTMAPHGKGGGKVTSNEEYIRAIKNRKTANGLKITEVHPHAIDRARGRGIFPKSVVDAVERGKVSKSKTHKNRSIHDYRGMRVIVEQTGKTTGKLITAIYKGKENKKK